MWVKRTHAGAKIAHFSIEFRSATQKKLTTAAHNDHFSLSHTHVNAANSNVINNAIYRICSLEVDALQFFFVCSFLFFTIALSLSFCAFLAFLFLSLSHAFSRYFLLITTNFHLFLPLDPFAWLRSPRHTIDVPTTNTRHTHTLSHPISNRALYCAIAIGEHKVARSSLSRSPRYQPHTESDVCLSVRRETKSVSGRCYQASQQGEVITRFIFGR